MSKKRTSTHDLSEALLPIGDQGKTHSKDPFVVSLDEVLDEGECSQLITLGTKKRRVNDGPLQLSHDSHSEWGPLVERIGKLVGLPPSFAESLTLIPRHGKTTCEVGHDAFDLGTERGRRDASMGGQRIITVLMFLNSIERGGNIKFPNLKVSIKAIPRSILIIQNDDLKTGSHHPNACYGSTALKGDVQWVASLVFRDCAQTPTVLTNTPNSKSAHTPAEKPLPSPPITALNPEAQKQIQSLWAQRQKLLGLVERVDGNLHKFGCRPEHIGTPNSRWVNISLGQPTYHLNRSNLLESVLIQKGWTAAKPTQCADFSMWSIHDKDERPARFKIFDRKETNELDDKAAFYTHLVNGHCQDLTPKTYLKVEDITSQNSRKAEFWFLKGRFGADSKEVHCYKNLMELKRDTKRFDMSRFIIQKAMKNPHLITGQKFNIRVYVCFLPNLSVFVYPEGLIRKNAGLYDPENTSDNANALHEKGTHALFSTQDFYPYVFPGILTVLKRTIPCMLPLLNERNEPNRFGIFGFDFLMDKSRKPWLLEVNAYPNLAFSSPTDKAVKIEMLSDFYNLFIGPQFFGTKPDPHEFISINAS